MIDYVLHPVFFFNDTATTEIYTLSLHDALPIYGEMGIGNTTTSSAVLYAMTQKNIHEVVGHGGGLSEEGLLRKKQIIQDACQRYQLDRKSTRLNSSHANISYAVFCLKKKKN